MCSLVVAADDGGVPLGGALGPVDFHPEAHEDRGGCQEDLLAVLGLDPAASRLPDSWVVLDTAYLWVPLLQQISRDLIIAFYIKAEDPETRACKHFRRITEHFVPRTFRLL